MDRLDDAIWVGFAQAVIEANDNDEPMYFGDKPQAMATFARLWLKTRSQLSTTTRELAEARGERARYAWAIPSENATRPSGCRCDMWPRGHCRDGCPSGEIDRLSADLSAVIAERDAALACTVTSPVTGATETLGRLMQERYGREARQWQANHDQRKAERDEARAERDEARERESRLLIERNPLDPSSYSIDEAEFIIASHYRGMDEEARSDSLERLGHEDVRQLRLALKSAEHDWRSERERSAALAADLSVARAEAAELRKRVGLLTQAVETDTSVERETAEAIADFVGERMDTEPVGDWRLIPRRIRAHAWKEPK